MTQINFAKNSKGVIMKLKEMLNNLPRKKLYLGIIASLLFVLIIWGIRETYAYYNDEATLPFINATIGNFLNNTEGNIKKMSDVNLLYYVEDENNSANYNLVAGVPLTGFKFNSNKSNCIPNDKSVTYSISENGRVDLEATESVPNQVVCRLFYQKSKDSDVIIYALIEDNETGTYLYNSKRYSFLSKLTENLNNYIFTYKCNSSDTQVTYENNRLSYIASKPDTCNVYFSNK